MIIKKETFFPQKGEKRNKFHQIEEDIKKRMKRNLNSQSHGRRGAVGV
jgi:hypothetical protein